MHDMTAADRILTVLPMFHVGGLGIQTLPALECGATVILEARFRQRVQLDLHARMKPTDECGGTRHPGSLAHSYQTGAPPAQRPACLRPARPTYPCRSSRRCARGVPVIGIYGATATGPVAIYQRIEQALSPAGSIGRRGLHRVRLVDEAGRDVRRWRAGRVLVRGPHTACGYWDQQAREAVPFVDGWFRERRCRRA
ncbi:MAG: AMP-binding protein [Bacteroidetes bacterium]|nr:AMP-binding protein [Bacteroidota bacterium]